MLVIESYSFGHMVIDRKSYAKDVIIYPDGSILSPWWRNRGHILETADLEQLIASAPDMIICGTGAMGVMRPSPALHRALADRNIEFIAHKTAGAVELYNSLAGKRKIGGCFHLTC